MDQDLKVILCITIFTGKENINGLMREFIMENGGKIKCVDKVVLAGLMAESIFFIIIVNNF
jgi:hypothetical protein